MKKEKIAKKFDDWNVLKKSTNFELKRVRVSRGQIWWAKVGQNIGVEIYGKHEDFLRPVLIIRPIEGGKNAIVLPLTSKTHKGSWYVGFKYRNMNETAIIAQIKSMDTSRLVDRIGEVSDRTVDDIIGKVCKYLLE